ncbi:uncharacterized protein LOC111636668 isoform X2 [Centruroides sculpturatus]|uniref:uncharacterized protein LOC111636668 isoform X2 n=1 Tax=Centruroides sculpturatus TaxID=218467 RepID=UPI000C6D81F3|nr:uncharacterized protein LOC111636668 isoform X2 [Centruroides sculpturatus]
MAAAVRNEENNVDRNESRENPPKCSKPVPISSKRVPKCSRCKNHGIDRELKNHKKFCDYKSCVCEKCCLTVARQRLMARKVALRREVALDEARGIIADEDPVFSTESNSTNEESSEIETNSSNEDEIGSTNRRHIREALQTLVNAFKLNDKTMNLYVYAILKECKFNVKLAYDKLIEAQTEYKLYEMMDRENRGEERREEESNYNNISWSPMLRQRFTNSSVVYPKACRPFLYPYTMNSNVPSVTVTNSAVPTTQISPPEEDFRNREHYTNEENYTRVNEFEELPVQSDTRNGIDSVLKPFDPVLSLRMQRDVRFQPYSHVNI